MGERALSTSLSLSLFLSCLWAFIRVIDFALLLTWISAAPFSRGYFLEMVVVFHLESSFVSQLLCISPKQQIMESLRILFDSGLWPHCCPVSNHSPSILEQVKEFDLLSLVAVGTSGFFL